MLAKRVRSGQLPPAPAVGVFWWFIAPFALLTLVFGVWPIVLAVQTSFTASATALQPQAKWVGWANYAVLWSDPIFISSMLHALLLQSVWIGRGRLFFKVAVFLPVVTPDIAGYVVWRWLYDQSFGAINTALDALGLPLFGGIASTSTVLGAVLVAELWHHVGFYVVIFWANLALCDKGQSEAAQIDGANAWQHFWHVLFPQLRPAILVNSVYALIQYLKTFTVVAVMTKGGPNESTNFVSYYAYQLFDQGRYGEATAMATVLFTLILLLAGLAMRLQGGGRRQ